ncbi:tyrosine-type recombinase/integrase [Undibacterium sp. SXout7W]|uniref:tyrosine-type recombinase/integrase n=1 Tax=Undibacterium sp. SXout7W TaxID=3413049 RepID=UPI003BF148F2
MSTELNNADQLNIEQWVAEPLTAFKTFIQSPEYLLFSRRKSGLKMRPHLLKQTISDKSALVYQTMFSKLISWLHVRKIRFWDLSDEDLFAFLEQKDKNDTPILKSEIQYRYLRLIENIFDYLQRPDNPARGVIFQVLHEKMYLQGRNLSPVGLSSAEIERFIAAMPVSDAEIRPSRLHAGWKKRRDRALQCVMLGGGLKVSEVVGLHISEVKPDVEVDGTLKVSLTPNDKHETSYRHDTYIQSEFVPDVLSWMQERTMVAVGGTLLFPGTNGKKLDKSSVYTQVKKTFTRAEISISRVGGRTLRNTFAIKELQAGEQLETLQKKLGLADQRSVFLYKSINKKINI